jgi:hypothetical protein
MDHEQADVPRLLVKRRCYDAGRENGAVKLGVRRESAPANWFERPPDYAQMDMGRGMR